VIHGTALDAVHAHSGCVVTANDPRPPAASIIGGVASETSHLLTAEGLVSDVVDDVSQPLVAAAAHTRTTAVTARPRNPLRTRVVALLMSALTRPLYLQ
jgi:hypothetical protein